MAPFRVRAAGDAALVLELPPAIDVATSARVVAVAEAVRQRFGPLIRDAVVGYHTATIYFDPAEADPAWFEREILGVAAEIGTPAVVSGPSIDVPVCYGGDLGPDLAEVAAAIGGTEEDVIQLHLAREYRVFVVGFVPGFAYMGTVDERLALPRRATPRTRVPAGSVAIAAGQTGVYPMETPGGWHILGRTPLRPFDERRAHPVLFHVGDRVRFQRISREDYERSAAW